MGSGGAHGDAAPAIRRWVAKQAGHRVEGSGREAGRRPNGEVCGLFDQSTDCEYGAKYARVYGWRRGLGTGNVLGERKWRSRGRVIVRPGLVVA